MRKKHPFIFFLFAFGFVGSIYSFALAAEESITVTTYYPSPYGVYSEMRLYPKSYSQATPCDANNEGLMFFDSDSSAHTLKVCMCKNPPTCVTSSDFGWVAATSYWTLSASGTNLYTNSNNWNVGIGTTGPERRLHVAQPNAGIVLQLQTTDPTAHGQLANGIGFYHRNPLDSSNTERARIATEAFGSGSHGGILTFWTAPYGSNLAVTEKMRIMNDGNVGIGTTGPGAKLDVVGPAITGSPWIAEAIRFSSVTYPTQYGSLWIDMSGASGGMALGVAGARSLYIAQTTGNVGIGTTGPSARLHISGPSTGTIIIVDGNQAAGRVLTSDANGVGTWQPPGGGGMSNIRVYTSSGTFTVPAGITKLWVEVYGGGGGGGGGCGGGGGAGGVAMGFVTVSPGQSIPVTVGAGGGNGCGGDGGNSIFSTLTGSGGKGGDSNSGNWNKGGVGGGGSGGSINQRGGPGAIGIRFCNSFPCAPSCIGGNGGYNTRGVGGDGVFIGQEAGSIFGGGGGGGPMAGCSGGYGGSGGVIIWY